jgi:hypothetical protein
MTVEDDDEVTLGAVSVPERMRQCLLKRLQGTQRIIIEWEQSDKKWKRVEAFRLQNKPGEWPENDDEIVQQCARIIEQHWEERGDGDPLNYRIWCTGYTKEGKRRRPSFEHLYAGPENEDPEQDDDDIDEEEQYTIAMVLRQQAGIIDKLALRLDEAHLHIRELSTSNTQMFEPLNNLVGYAGQMYVAAMEMQKRAMFVIHDHKRQEREAEAQDRRMEKYVQIVGPALKRLAPAFASWVKSKIAGEDAGPAPTVDDMQDDGDEAEDIKPPWEQPAKPQSEADADETPSAHYPDEPLADMARSLSQMLKPGDWGTAAKRFTKAEFGAFTELLDARTDKDVVTRWDKIVDGAIDLGKLIALADSLDEDQKEAFDVFQRAVAQAKGEA